MPGRFAAADPVIRAAPGILPLQDVPGVDAVAEPRDANAAELDREVDVQDDVRIAMFGQSPADELLREDGAAVEGEVLPDERGEGDGGDVEERSFEGGRDRAGVGDV